MPVTFAIYFSPEFIHHRDTENTEISKQYYYITRRSVSALINICLRVLCASVVNFLLLRRLGVEEVVYHRDDRGHAVH